MMEKILLSEVEKNLPSGTPANIRALEINGNSILSTITDVAKAIGIILSLIHISEPTRH